MEVEASVAVDDALDVLWVGDVQRVDVRARLPQRLDVREALHRQRCHRQGGSCRDCDGGLRHALHRFHGLAHLFKDVYA